VLQSFDVPVKADTLLFRDIQATSITEGDVTGHLTGMQLIGDDAISFSFGTWAFEQGAMMLSVRNVTLTKQP
jgi:hypothetical protein